MILKYDKPRINAHFEDSSDKCVITVRQYLVEDKYHPPVQTVVKEAAVVVEYEDGDEEEEDRKCESNQRTFVRTHSELTKNPLLNIAHDQRWLISFKRMQGSHGTYCSLVEKLIFSEAVAAALTWEEILEATSKLSAVDSERALNDLEYELHDHIEESCNVKETLEETASDSSSNTVIVSVADAHFKEYVYAQ